LYIVSNASTATVSNSSLSGNSVDYGVGGGIYNYGTLTVSDSTVSGNSAYEGGGIENFGTLMVSDSTLSGNSTAYGHGGGGIYNALGTLTVSGSTLSGNTAGFGGGIYNAGYYPYSATLTVSNSTLSGNTADYGGGIYNSYGTLTVSNSTLSGNSASGLGGGIYNQGTLTLSNSTLTANRATFVGGGLEAYFGSPVLHNTLVAGNFGGATGTTAADVDGRLDLNGDYNLIGDGTRMTGLTNGVNGNQVGSASGPIDPLLGPLDDNGGPTFTMALLPGSPAIDAGNNAYATDFDQRGPGYPRIVNGIIDIGAFEVQAHAHGRRTELPLPDPVAVEPLQGGPLVGQPPDLPGGPSALPEPGIPDGQTGQPEPVPTGGSQEDPPLSLAVAPPTPGQPADSLGPLGLWDEMAGWS
jgi:hypothetical protein